VGLLRRGWIGDNELVRQPFSPGSDEARAGVEESQ
jgi:hypothetical protein